MVRLALLLLAASTATAAAEGWSASLAGGAFVVTPTFNPNHKRQTRPDNEIPESRVAGIRIEGVRQCANWGCDWDSGVETERGFSFYMLIATVNAGIRF